MPSRSNKQATIAVAAGALLAVALLLHAPNVPRETVVIDPASSPQQLGDGKMGLEIDFQSLKAWIKAHPEIFESEESNSTLSLVIRGEGGVPVRVYPVDEDEFHGTALSGNGFF